MRSRVAERPKGPVRTADLAARYELLATLVRSDVVVEGLEPVRVLRDACRLMNACEFDAARMALDCIPSGARSRMAPSEQQIAATVVRYIAAVTAAVGES